MQDGSYVRLPRAWKSNIVNETIFVWTPLESALGENTGLEYISFGRKSKIEEVFLFFNYYSLGSTLAIDQAGPADKSFLFFTESVSLGWPTGVYLSFRRLVIWRYNMFVDDLNDVNSWASCCLQTATWLNESEATTGGACAPWTLPILLLALFQHPGCCVFPCSPLETSTSTVS